MIMVTIVLCLCLLLASASKLHSSVHDYFHEGTRSAKNDLIFDVYVTAGSSLLTTFEDGAMKVMLTKAGESTDVVSALKHAPMQYRDPLCDHRHHCEQQGARVATVLLPLNATVDPLLLLVLQSLSSVSSVLRVSVKEAARTTNFEARGIVEQGTSGAEVFTRSGLDGKGEVVGVSDTGLDDGTCWFRDDDIPDYSSSRGHNV